METKTFNIFRKDDSVKIQIGDDVIGLDNEERNRLLRLFLSIKETKMLFPAGLQGACLMYPDGLIAMNISVSKINLMATKYFLFLYHQTPQSTEFDANTFMLSGVVIDKYIRALKGEPEPEVEPEIEEA